MLNGLEIRRKIFNVKMWGKETRGYIIGLSRKTKYDNHKCIMIVLTKVWLILLK